MSEREACKPCGGRGWVVGECHPQEPCALCNGIGFFPGELAFADRDTWRARAEKAETALEAYRTGRDEAWYHAACLSIAEGIPGWDSPIGGEFGDSLATKTVRALRARAIQAEAQASALLRIIVTPYANAGRTLLAELEALREVERIARRVVSESSDTLLTLFQFDEALAAVDAARKGE